MVEPPEAEDKPESELDEMRSYVGKKDNPRALVACYRAPKWKGFSLCLWSAQGRSLFAVESPTPNRSESVIFTRMAGELMNDI